MLCRSLCALLFIAWTAEWPLETDKILYLGLWRSPLKIFTPLFVSVPNVSLFPWQMLVLGLAPVCLLWPGAFRRRAPSLDLAMVVSFASIAVTFLWGIVQGGSAYNAYYQLWRFLLALLVGLMLVSVIRNSEHLRVVGRTVLAAALTRATLAVYFYWTFIHGRFTAPPPHLTTHDDSVLFVAGIAVALSWALARARWTWWIATFLVTSLLLYAIVLNNRRLAWIELLLVFAVAYFMLPRGGLRRRVNRLMVFAAPAFVVYLAIGWGREGAVFAPARALATAGSNDDNSSLARQEEIRNLLYTLSAAGNPLLGTGWGVPYQKVTSVYANFGAEWWQYLYMPHNSLLGIAVFAGLVGIAGIWCVVPMSAFLGMRGYRGSTEATDRAAAMAAVAVLPAYGAQCFGDIGFQSLTAALVLAVAMGVAGKVSAFAAAREAAGAGPRARPRAAARAASPSGEELPAMTRRRSAPVAEAVAVLARRRS